MKKHANATAEETLRRLPRAAVEAAYDKPYPDILVMSCFDMLDEDRQIFSELGEKHLNGFERPFALVTDLRSLSYMPPTQRAMYAAVRQAVRNNYKRYHILTVYIVRDDAQRGLVTAIGWVAPAEATAGRTFVPTLHEALQLCRSALTEHYSRGRTSG